MPDWVRDIAWVFTGMLFPVGLWIVRLLLEIRDDARDTRAVLFGVRDQKGLVTRVERAEDRAEDHEKRITRLEENAA